MAPRSRKRSRAIGLSVIALSALALIPTASAATSSGIFQVTATDEENPSITKTVGMKASATEPGSGGGEAVPSCALTMPQSIRQVGLINGKLNAADQTLSMGAPYMAALTGKESGSDYGISGWIDEVQDNGGTLEIGEPTIKAVSTVNNTEYVSLPAQNLRSMVGEAGVIGPGQIGDDWWTDADLKDQVNEHSSIRLSGTQSVDDFQPIVYQMMVDAGYAKNGALIQTQNLSLDYPLSVKWNSDSKYASCSVSMTAHMDVDIASY